MKFRGYFFACLSAISYGMIPLFALPLKQSGVSFDVILFYRFLFTSALILLFLLGRKIDLKISKKEVLPLVFLGLMYALSSEFLFLGYDYMPAGVASTILFIYPVFVALLMGFLFKEKISWLTRGAIMLALGGVFVLNQGEGEFSMSLIGLIVVLLSALAYALYIVVVNKSAVRDMSGPKLTFYSIAFAGLFFGAKSVALGQMQLVSFQLSMEIALFALVTTVISCIALVYAIQYIGSTPTAILGSLEPVVAVGISVVLFHEPLTKNLMLGILLIVLAVVVIILSDHIMRDLRRFKKAILFSRK